MNKQPVLLALSGIILVSAVIIGVIYERGLGPDDVPIDDSGPTPAPLHQPNITVSATYNETAETVRIRIESGRVTAAEYDTLRITSHSGGDVGDARLKRPGQTKIHPSGKWVDTESGGLTSFPVKSGDSIIVVTVDQTDNDGDGIDGIDGDDSLELNYVTDGAFNAKPPSSPGHSIMVPSYVAAVRKHESTASARPASPPSARAER